jgi:hypothetical protein
MKLQIARRVAVWRVGALAAWWACATACASYTCGDFTVFGVGLREQCGPLGSSGEVFFEEGVATMLMGPSIDDFASPDFDAVLEYGPLFDVAFDAAALSDLGPASVIAAECIRKPCYDCFTEFIPALAVEVEVLAPSERGVLGGKSWRLRWQIDCPPQAEMSSSGEDVVEFTFQSTGYQLDPPSWFP